MTTQRIRILINSIWPWVMYFKLYLKASLPLFFLIAALSTKAETLSTLEEAIHRSFPGAQMEREVIYLDEQQEKQISELAGTALNTSIIYAYHLKQSGKDIGTVYLDAHRVRTLSETLMIILSPESTVQQIDVLSFAEPQEYRPRKIWYDQFLGQELSPKLQLGRDIDGVTGATLTARATTQALRRVLAIHSSLRQNPAHD